MQQIYRGVPLMSSPLNVLNLRTLRNRFLNVLTFLTFYLRTLRHSKSTKFIFQWQQTYKSILSLRGTTVGYLQTSRFNFEFRFLGLTLQNYALLSKILTMIWDVSVERCVLLKTVGQNQGFWSSASQIMVNIFLKIMHGFVGVFGQKFES